MESVTRNVRDINPAHRRSLEDIVGQKLRDNQQIIIQVMTLGAKEPGELPLEQSKGPSAGVLPDYCNVYDGLTDEEIADLEAAILPRSPSRSST